MIIIYEGPVRAGKSYHVVVNELFRAVKERRKIYTNLAGLNKREISWLCQVPLGEIDIELINDKHEWQKLLAVAEGDRDCKTLAAKHGALVIVDEAQMIWFSREWKDTAGTFVNFLSYHGHADMDCVFITQDIKLLDAAIRRLANEILSVRNHKWLGLRLLKNSYQVKKRLHEEGAVVTSTTYQFKSDNFRAYQSALQVDRQLAYAPSVPRQVWILTACFLFCLYAAFGLRKNSVMSWAGSSRPKPLVPAPVSPYGDFIKGGSPTMPEAPKVELGSTSSENLEQKIVICEKRRFGGCITWQGKQECNYEYKQVCPAAAGSLGGNVEVGVSSATPYAMGRSDHAFATGAAPYSPRPDEARPAGVQAPRAGLIISSHQLRDC